MRARKDEHVQAHDEDDEMLLLDSMVKRSPSRSLIRSRSQVAGASQTKSSPRRPQRPTKRPGNDSSETEPESDDEPQQDMPLTPRSTTPDTQEAGRAPGRIIGSAYPLKDFKDNLARGDLVTKAVEDLSEVIKETVVKPFAYRRADEMLECMQELRKVALEVSNFCRELQSVVLNLVWNTGG